MFYIICYLASQWAIMNDLCKSGWYQLKLSVESEEALRCIFSQKNTYNISWACLIDWNYFGTLVYITGGWIFCSSLNVNIKDRQASTFVAVLNCVCSCTCPVVEGSPSVLWGVRSAAGERACAGPAERGRVSVCPQGDARQDPGYGKGNTPSDRMYRLNISQHTILLYDLIISLHTSLQF